MGSSLYADTDGNVTNCCSQQKGVSSYETSEIPDFFRLLATAYLVILDIMIVLGNGWVMFIIVSKQRKSMYVLSSLVVSDFLTGITSIPLYLTWLHHEELFSSLSMCFATLTIALFLSVASILNIIAVTMERFIAICYPLIYKTHFRASFNRALSLVVGCIWTISFSVSLLSTMFMKSDFEVCAYYFVFQEAFLFWTITTGVFIPLCLLVLVYVKILISVRRSIASLHIENPTVNISDGRSRHKSIKRLIITLFLVLSCFIVCWCPLFVSVVVLLICKNCQLPKVAYEAIVLLGFTNSLANVFIYCLRHKSFRRMNNKTICSTNYDVSRQSYEAQEIAATEETTSS